MVRQAHHERGAPTPVNYTRQSVQDTSVPFKVSQCPIYFGNITSEDVIHKAL